MSAKVEVRREGNVAVIIADNPPVNALSHALRSALIDALALARDDAKIEAIVLACAGRTFVAGADIAEFDRPPQSPGLSDLIALFDLMRKPVVAALFGTPLGGGFELALGCHFRVADSATKAGLPEIKLGLIPGAGGTQRLPRFAGMEKALAMILSGDPVTAQDALAHGLIEEITQGDVTAGAIAFARKAIAEKRPLRRARDRDETLDAFRKNPAQFESLAASFLKRAQGQDAPAAAIEALRGAITLPFDEAIARERTLFVKLRDGDQSKARRHIFFAERQAAKVDGLPKEAGAPVERAAVIGAGTMGAGIAMCFANAGIPVTLVETGEDALRRGLAAIEKNYHDSVSRGRLSENDMTRRMAIVAGAIDIAAAAEADSVIEAVFEELPVKEDVFRKLDKVAKDNALLATNTSYLDVNAIARATARPDAVLGMHFFSPANVMRLLEIVRGEKTSPEVLARAIALARKLGKIPVVVGVCHGFVGNRMLRARSIEAERLLLEGALPQDVDAALINFGFPMGPFAMSDLAGLDVSWRMRKAQGARAEIADALCEAGQLGQKTGRGFYRYEKGSRAPLPDADTEALIVAASKTLGIARKPIAEKEILERLIFPMINEGARILDEGIAARASDIDVIWVHGYGFPAWRGGPMFFADRTGLPYIRDRLAQFARATDDASLEPAPLLAKLAAAGEGFGAHARQAA